MLHLHEEHSSEEADVAVQTRNKSNFFRMNQKEKENLIDSHKSSQEPPQTPPQT